MKKMIFIIMLWALTLTPLGYAEASIIGIEGSSTIEWAYVAGYHDSGAEHMVVTSPTTVTANLTLEWAGYKNGNSFGIYSFTSSNGGYVINDKLELFTGPDNPGKQVTLTFLSNGSVIKDGGGQAYNIGSTFGFYIHTEAGKWFYSHTGSNGDGLDHFVMYNLPTELVIGVEDLWGGGDRDYNDMVVRVVNNVSHTPIPGGIWLLGSGLIGLVCLRRKTKR